MTMLDQNRGVAAGGRAGVQVRDVTDLAIWGNHSSTQFPDAGTRASAAAGAGGDRRRGVAARRVHRHVQQRGAAIIKARGQSSAASAANAVIDTVREVARRPASSSARRSRRPRRRLRVPEGWSSAIRCEPRAGKVEIVQGIEHDDFGRSKIEATTQELLEERAAVEELLRDHRLAGAHRRGTAPHRCDVDRAADRARHEGDDAIDIAEAPRRDRADHARPGYGNTGACTSAITFLDGEEGILRYRGYPIEQLAEHSTFLEVAYLLIWGELPDARAARSVRDRGDALTPSSARRCATSSIRSRPMRTRWRCSRPALSA
jgi:hypothetical protein